VTRRRRINQRRVVAIEKARADYIYFDGLAKLAEAKAVSARNAANERLWAWLDMIEPMAAKALKGK
jgi:S-methylmethionine-dependent homocysteine/selenocysteine methylase